MKCPNCSSADTVWKAKAEKWECNSCEERFDGKSCPHCNSQDVVWKSKAGEWECSSCEERFSNETTETPTELEVVDNKSDTLTSAGTPEEILSLAELAAKYQKIEEELNEEWDENNPISCELGGEDWREELDNNLKNQEQWLQKVRPNKLKEIGLNPNETSSQLWKQVYALLNEYTRNIASSYIDFEEIIEPEQEGDVIDYFYEMFEQLEPQLANFQENEHVPKLINLWYQVLLERPYNAKKEAYSWMVGQFYCFGFGCEKDIAKGEKCFESIASEYDKYAKELSIYYLKGYCEDICIGITMADFYKIKADFPVDLKKSFHWLQIAMKNYEPYSLCVDYVKHINKKSNKKLFNEIQSNPSFESQYLHAALYYLGGCGIEVDNKKGFELLQGESKKGNHYAQYSLAMIFLNSNPPNYAVAEKLLKSASGSKFYWAQSKLEELKKQKPQSNLPQSNGMKTIDSSPAKPQGFFNKLFGGFVSSNAEVILQSMVESANAQAPMQIDELTRLDGAKSIDSCTLCYLYTITNESADNIDWEIAMKSMREQNLINYKTNKDLSTFKENGINAKYIYKNTRGEILFDFTITSEEMN